MKNKKVFIIQGFEGKPNGAWKSWLMVELDRHDIYACSLAMPHSDAPILSDWLDEVKRHVDMYPNDDIYLVGHSIGGVTILRYFEKYNSPNVKGVCLCATRSEKLVESKLPTFFDQDFDFDAIRKNIPTTVVIHGNDDPVVPTENAERTAKELEAKLVWVPNGKHLNGSAGIMELPECLNALLEMIK